MGSTSLAFELHPRLARDTCGLHSSERERDKKFKTTPKKGVCQIQQRSEKAIKVNMLSEAIECHQGLDWLRRVDDASSVFSSSEAFSLISNIQNGVSGIHLLQHLRNP